MSGDMTYCGVPGTQYIWHGEWSDPEVIYKGISFSEASIVDGLISWYREEHPEDESEKGFEDWMNSNEGRAAIEDELDNLVFALYESAATPEEIVKNVKELGGLIDALDFVKATPISKETIVVYYAPAEDADIDDIWNFDEKDVVKSLEPALDGTGWGVDSYDFPYEGGPYKESDHIMCVVLRLGLGFGDMN